MAKKKARVHESSKAVWVILAIVVVVLIAAFTSKPSFIPTTPTAPITSLMSQPTSFNFGNKTFMINDEELAFNHGAYNSSDGQHTATITNRIANPSGTNYAAVLADNPDGSGTFYYLVGASRKDEQEVYSAPILLGDRIKVVTVNVEDKGAEDNGVITVKYLDRPADADMASEPTEEVTKQFAFQEDGNLIEVLH